MLSIRGDPSGGTKIAFVDQVMPQILYIADIFPLKLIGPNFKPIKLPIKGRFVQEVAITKDYLCDKN